MSAGLPTSVARPAQYTPSRSATPSKRSASVNAITRRIVMTSPVPRSTALNADASRSGSFTRSSEVSVQASETAAMIISMPTEVTRCWSSRYFSTVPSVASIIGTSSSAAPRRPSAVAQSMVSATPGGL